MFSPKYWATRYDTYRYWAPSGNFDNVRFIQIADLSKARSLDLLPQRINYVTLQAEGQNVRYRMDGIAPTAGIGMILFTGAAPVQIAGSIGLLQFIEVTPSAKLNVHYF